MSTPERLRVVTLNLWGDRAPLAHRIEAAAEALRKLVPDVLLLQEVRVGDGVPNTADWLATRMGVEYAVSYSPATRGAPGTWGPESGAGEEGLAIISRHAITRTSVIELPDARPTERRILASARIDKAGRTFWCHVTHLHWRLADGLARERQVVAIDEAIRSLPGDDGMHILGGDFNAAPDCDEIRFLCGRHTLGGRRTYYQDAFARRRPGSPGHTWSQGNPNTEWLRWLELDRRIDYLFVTPEQRDGRGRVIDADLVMDRPSEDGVWPSDHFGVMADILV